MKLILPRLLFCLALGLGLSTLVVKGIVELVKLVV
jgi:hypothetical protein